MNPSKASKEEALMEQGRNWRKTQMQFWHHKISVIKNGGQEMKNNNYEVMTAAKEMNIEITRLYKDILRTGEEHRSELEEKIRKLLELQRDDGSWSALDDLRADTDYRIDFAYTPTYMATAALMHAMNLGITERSVEESLRRGLTFARGRNLCGHGFEAVQGQLEALKIYKDAGLYEWMQKHADEYPEFTAMIR